MKMPYVREAQTFMQFDGHGIVGIDTGDHDVLLHCRCLIHELNHQLSANALTAPVGADMNAVLHTVLIAWRRAKFAKSPEAGNTRCILSDDEGKAAGAFGIEPGGAAFRGQLDFGIDRRRRANHFVVDAQDSREIFACGRD
jgi:hypothetical protein